MIELGHLSLIMAVVLSGLHGLLLGLSSFFVKKDGSLQVCSSFLKSLVKKRAHSDFSLCSSTAPRSFSPVFLTPLNTSLFTFSLFSLLLGALVCLAYANVIDDFSVLSVAENSHTTKPLAYKIAGVWASHQGSALFWLLGLALCSVVFLFFSRHLPPNILHTTLALQSSLIFVYGVFVLFTSNPFLREVPFPAEGLDLNPLLQDPGLTYHPPALFGGQVVLSLLFSLTGALLLHPTPRGVQWLKPWALLAFGGMTLGILTGSWWAYYVLGWGGWWFWDPVEVASLIPWLVMLQLIHVLQRPRSKSHAILALGLAGMIATLFSTFIVRSGILTSVHMFAVDPQRGFLLALMILGTFFSAYALYHRGAKAYQKSSLSRSTRSIKNMGLTLHAAFTYFVLAVISLGLLGPILYEAFQGLALSVGPTYYAKLLWPGLIPWALLLAVGPLLPTSSTSSPTKVSVKSWCPRIFRGSGLLLLALLAAYALALFLSRGLGEASFFQSLSFKEKLLFLGTASASFFIIGSGLYQIRRALKQGRFKTSLPALLSHVGVGVFLMGMVSDATFEQEKLLTLKPGQSAMVYGTPYTLQALDKVPGENYLSTRAHISLSPQTHPLVLERRHYIIRQALSLISAVHRHALTVRCLTLGDPQADGSWQIRVRINPFLLLVWLGGAFIILGCLIGFIRTHNPINRH